MGFDNECILNIQSLAGEYFCPVCRTLVYPSEALQSQCTHLYCKPCLAYVVGTTRACPYDGYLVTEADSKPLVESNKALAETIGKIAVHCLYHRSGCTWQGPLSDCTSHCSGCTFGNSAVICNRCGIQIVHRQVQEHAQSCPGSNPQAQQATENVQDTTTSGTATAASQAQTTTQSVAPTSQPQTSQATAAPPPGQNPNQQTNANPQGQAVAQVAAPTPEQWYQQQYQQYYQQYPGYDPYQQSYQQYYPHQQQIAQQFQQYPVQGQQPQVYTQPQVQPQAQPQVQPQAQPLAQLHTPSQPQPQIPPHGQSQQHLYGQAPVAAHHHNQAQINPQQQHPAVQPHASFQPQTHPPPHGHLPPQAQPYPQAQPHPQPQMQLPQYQQPHPQVLHPQLQVQPQAHPQPQPQPQPQLQPQLQPQPQPQPQPHSHVHPQAQLQNHPQPQPQLPPPPPTQPQGQQSSAHVVSAHHSYPQQPGHPHQQMQPALTQLPMHIHPSSGSLPPTQMHGQFPQQPPPMRPPLSHALVPNQQLPSQGQVASIPPAQQQQIQPHTQQPGHPVHQRPVMQQTQQQYVQQPFPGQTSGPVQSQLNQQGHFAPQQPMQSQLHPQGPPHSLQQHSLTHLQPQQNVTSQQSQNYAGRPVMPIQGVQSQHFTKSPGTFGVAAQVGPMQLGLNQPSGHQNYANRASSQPQESSEQQFVQSGQTTKNQDVATDRSVMGREPGSPSQKTAEKDANGLGADSHNVKALKSETGMNFMNDGKSLTVDKTLDKDAGSGVHAAKVGSGEPVIKQAVNEEGSESTLSSLHGGKSVEIASLDGKDATTATPKQAEHSIEDSSLRQAESLDVNKTKLQKDESAKASTVTDRGSKTVALVPSSNLDGSGENVISQGNSQTPLISRDRQLPPMPYGPSTHQQRPTVPSMVQPGHLPGPPPNAQLAGYPPNIIRPLGPGHLPPSGQPFNPSDHFQPPLLNQPGSFNPDIPPSGFSVQGSTVPFGRGPAQFGHPQRSFELQSNAPQGQYNQGHMPPPHAGVSRSSQGEPAGGPPLGAVPPSGSYGPQGGIMGRAPTHGPGGQIGLQRPINSVETEMFPNQRSHQFDGRHPDSHVPGYMERGPFGQLSAIESGMPRMNGAPGLDSPSTLGPRDERFKTFSGENMNSFPMGPTQRLGQGEFEEGLKQFPRPSHLGPEPSPKFGSSFPSSRPMDRGPNGLGMDSISRPFDKPPRGFNYDDGLKMDSGERAPPVGFHDDNRGRDDRTLGPVPGFGRHHMERPRSPGREFDISSHGFGGPSGVPRGQPSFDDIDGKGTRSFGEGSRSFNLPSDPGGNSFRDSRFPLLPGHLQREIDGHGNSRMGEHSRSGELIGQDSLPGHLRRGEFPGPHNLPSHMRLGEPTAFGNFSGPGSFPRPVPLGESFGGKKPTHPRLGEPGFRSSYSLHGFPNDGGFYAGDADSFDRLRAKKPSSMGWCRICKVDCETVEGLDLHAQTREHQKMTMDMVVGIKQQNAKKRKTSNDHPSLEEASRSRNAGFEGRNNKS